ncbi:MAG: amidohydrolase family protein [Bacteroidia bacterium]|nr:amidohydrolase family protein [Bacteroidia bacterium]
MRKISYTYILLCSLLMLGMGGLQAQMSKGKNGTFALKNATIHTVTNGTQTGTLIIQDGKITAMGASVSIPAGAEEIDCSGKHIYPGMIDGGTTLGLSEISSISLTNDFREVGDLNPHMQALTAVNPNAVAIPVTRVNGVTTVLAQPTGGIFPGTAALINLHGYTPKQMYAGFKAVRLLFPATGRRSRFDRRSEEDMKKDLDKKLKKLNEVWDQAKAFAEVADAHKAGKAEEPAYYPEMEALVPVVKGEAKLLIEVNSASDILSAISWCTDKGVDAIFTGVAEGWRVAEKLAESKIPVITGPVLQTPRRSSDRYDKAYANAGLMQKAGVKVAIRTDDSENVRNLPFNAGFAAAYGMGTEEALKAVTIIPAEIFGVSEQLGSIEVGKSATLFVSDGDPFETKTTISHLFIEGWNIPIDSRQIRLYDEFLERDPGTKK